MSPQLIATIFMWAVGLILGLFVVPFVIWLVKSHFGMKLEMANMRADFVTWEHWRKVEQWREETSREFTQVRNAIQQVAVSLARLEGAPNRPGG